jgi:hypothetical protein
MGLKEQIKGVFICENYSSCESCIFELLPQPYTVPDSSSAKQWKPPAAIFFTFLILDYIIKEGTIFTG